MKKKNIISVALAGVACASVVAMAGCGLFGNNNQPEETVTETTIAEANVDILEELANNEALVDTKVQDNKITEYFTDGTFVEYENETNSDVSSENNSSGEADSNTVSVTSEDVIPGKETSTSTEIEQSNNVSTPEESKAAASKVIVHTPTEKVIRDKEGIVKVADVNINTEKQNLIYKDSKIVIQEKNNSEGINQTEEQKIETTEATPTEKEDNSTETVNSETTLPNITPTDEKIIDVVKVEEKDINYTVTEYEKEKYDEAFDKRETFVENAKDTDEKISEVINKEVTEVVEDIKKKEEEAKKKAEEEAKAQDIKETETHKDEEGNTVVTGTDNEGNKVEIVTDKNGNTEVKKTDDSGNTVAVTPIATQPKQTQPAQTQPKQTQPVATQPKQTQPAQTQPKQTQPVATQPKQTEVPKPTQTAHTHNWQPVYKTVHHDAVTHQETYTEKEPYTYEKKIYGCQVYIAYTNSPEWEKGQILLETQDESYASRHCYTYLYADRMENGEWPFRPAWRTGAVIGTETVTAYRDVQKTRTVTDKPAWDEQVIDYYKCSCGATK